MNLHTRSEKNEDLLGVVTVLYNSDDVIPGFFESIANQKNINIKLYIIDNSPSDSGTNLCKSFAEKYNIETLCIYNNKNLGVAAGNNQGIIAARRDGCENILIANNDIEFGDGVISGLLKDLKENVVDAITPKIYYHNTDKLIWFAGGSISEWTTRVPHYGIGKKDIGQYNQKKLIRYAPTCFLMLKTEVFNKIGLMDEAYFCYYDDTDFIYRLIKNCGKILYAPSFIVEHKVSTSTGGDESPFSVYYFNRNKIYFLRKNLRGIKKFTAILWVLLTRIIRIIQSNKRSRERIISGIRDGFALPISQTIF
jgi:GT2 family glycosyltransferase